MKYALLTSALLLSGCATITQGTGQDIRVATLPDGASCTLSRAGVALGTIESTPGSVHVERTKDDISIICNKRGYGQAEGTSRSKVEGAVLGNILLGGGIGWAIDSANGSDNKYETPVNILLDKK